MSAVDLDSPNMAERSTPKSPPVASEQLDRLIDLARQRRAVAVLMVSVAVIAALLGLETLVFHLTTDPLADVHAYYDAGTRLNAGAPLYPPTADPDAP